ncbi:MAG TPA: acyltransferase [Alphaproteobacteria bacterium]
MSDMRERYLLIDVARGFAALSILLWHYQHFYYLAPGRPEFLPGAVQPFYGLLFPFYEAGFLSVQLFWLISGFVFFSLYKPEDKIDGWTFFVHRFSRLYPLHFVTLLAVAALQALSMARLGQFQIYSYNDGFHFLLHFFMASDWARHTQKELAFNQPIWSVSVEILTYLLFVLFCRFLPRSIWIMALISALSVGLFVVTGNLAFKCVFYFFVGGLVHHFCVRRPVFANPRTLVPLAVLALAGLIAVHVAIYRIHGWYNLLPEALAATFGPVILFLLARAESYVDKARIRRFVWIGDITYATYLCHIPVQISVLIFLQSRGIPQTVADSGLFFVSYMAFMILLGVIVYNAFERPAQSYLRQKLLRPSQPAVQSF